MQSLTEIQQKNIEAMQARRELYVATVAVIAGEPYRVVEGVAQHFIATDYLKALIAVLDKKIALLQGHEK